MKPARRSKTVYLAGCLVFAMLGCQSENPAIRGKLETPNASAPPRIGIPSVNAQWANYGAYMYKVISTVQISWDTIVDQSEIRPISGTEVSVTFVLNSDGKIARIVHHTPEGQAPAIDACVRAITDPSPYGPWTKEMIATLGTEQEITFTFYYE